MSIINFETKNYKSIAFVWANRPNIIIVRIHKEGAKKLTQYFVPVSLTDKIKKLKSHTALVAFAKANQITDSASDAHSGSDSASVTSCPVPAPAPAKSAAKGRGIFIDTETTGRGRNDEIIEIAVIDEAETVLFQSLIKPKRLITKASTKVHGITNKMVADAPSFADVWAELVAVIADSTIVFYNQDFDTRMIRQSVAIAFDSPTPEHFYTLFPRNKTFCLMSYYARNHGVWSDYYQAGKFASLVDACKAQCVPIDDLSNHRAIDDAIKTVRLYKRVKSLKGRERVA